jgi:hypothetical protein
MKSGNHRKWNRVFCGLIGISALVLTVAPSTFADEGGVYQDNSGADSSNFLTKTANRMVSGLGSLLGVKGLFEELSSADVGHKPRVKPHFAFVQGFNSNARLANDQRDAAWQARVAPGITVSVPSGKLYTEADYTYGFSTIQGRKTNANVSTHNLNAMARYDLTADTVLGAGNNIQLSEVPGAPGRTFVLETATAQMSHRLGPKLRASLTDTFQWFKDRSLTDSVTSFDNDFKDNGVAAAFTYDAAEDLSLGPTFSWNIRDFDDIDMKDYWEISPGLNASYDLGPKTILNGNFGWAYRNFRVDDSSESQLVYGASATHKLGRKLVWSVSYAKTMDDTYNTSFVFREVPTTTILDNYDRDLRVIKAHQIGSSAAYNFSEKQSIGAFGNFQFLSGDSGDSIIGRENDEKAMEVGGGYTYRFNRFIALDVLYTLGKRFSGDNNAAGGRNAYTYHKVTGGVNIVI